MRRNRSERQQAHCDHHSTVSTVSAGIVRIACEGCGYTRMRHHHDLVVVGAGQQHEGKTPAITP